MKTQLERASTRRSLAAREELVNKLRNIARTKNKTLYGLTNEILEQAIHLSDSGEELNEMIKDYRYIKIAKENRSVLIPEKIWYMMLDKALEKKDYSLMKTFYDSGLWYGKYFSSVLSEKGTIEEIDSALRTFLLNVASLEVEQKGDKVLLRCTEPNFTDSHTHFISMMLEGIMHSLGYGTARKKIARGLLVMTFSKKALGVEQNAFER